MKEKNRIKLKKGLQGLPEYSPPDNIWDGISEDLEQNPVDHELQACIAELPSYEPPVAIWDAIESNLDESKVISMNRSTMRSKYSKWLAAASIAMLIGFSGWFLWSSEEFSEEAIVSISHETKVNFDGKRSDDQAEVMIGEVLAEVKAMPHMWEAPKTVALRKSLDKIKASIYEFQVAGKQFGMNQRMHEQLTDMYNKRNKIVRTLASLI